MPDKSFDVRGRTAVITGDISGVQRGSRPFAGVWGTPPVSFFSRAHRAQRNFVTALGLE